MAARKTVKPNMDKLHLYVSESGWSNAAFARKVGKHDRWLSEMARGRNFPSPEEAARMCVLLQTTPEEILVEQADIDLVNGLLAQEREKSAKKERPAEGGTLSGEDKETAELREIWNSADSDERQMLLEIAKTLKSRRK